MGECREEGEEEEEEEEGEGEEEKEEEGEEEEEEEEKGERSSTAPPSGARTRLRSAAPRGDTHAALGQRIPSAMDVCPSEWPGAPWLAQRGQPQCLGRRP